MLFDVKMGSKFKIFDDCERCEVDVEMFEFWRW